MANDFILVCETGMVSKSKSFESALGLLFRRSEISPVIAFICLLSQC